MNKNVQQCWIFTILLCNLLLIGSKMVAQEVYFAENPPMILDKRMKQIPNLTIEYSAKNNGIIRLELVHNKSTIIGEGTFVVKKRGSNTATINLQMLHSNTLLTSKTNYEYRLTLFEYTDSTTDIPNSNINPVPNENILAINLYEQSSGLKKAGKTTVVHGVQFQ